MPTGVYPRRTVPAIERFWPKVDQSGGPDACWPWIGKKRDGYGRFYFSAARSAPVLVQAHRIAFELVNGPVPPEIDVCHTCDNPPCCNPAHLFLGDNADNTADRTAKGRTYCGPMNQGAANGRARLTPQLVAEIREQYVRGGVSQAALARVYGVVPQHISNIVRRTRWA